MRNIQSETQRLEVLDSFRGLAALLVAIYHYTLDKGELRHFLLIHNAHRFVEFFFVLSGFIIYMRYSDLRLPKAQVSFLRKRLFRLYPLHIFVLGLFVTFEIAKLVLYNHGLFNNKPFTTNSIASLMPNLLLLQGLANSSKDFTWNYPSWSISVEAMTYVFFCITTPLIANKSNPVKSVFISLVSIVAVLLLTTTDVGVFRFLLRCIYGFYFGCLIQQNSDLIQKYIRNWDQASKTAVEILVLTSMVSAICYLPARYDFLLTPLYGFVILAFASENGIVSQVLKKRPFLLLGTLSYSVYMVHALIANVLKVLFINILKLDGTYFDLTIIPFTVCVITMSYLTYHYIESIGKKFSKKQYSGMV